MAHNAAVGYPLDIFTGDITEAEKCISCNFVLKEPLQTECGHRICKACYDQLCAECDYNTKAAPECPVQTCCEPLVHDTVFPDRFAARLINDMETVCPNSLIGCEWTGKLKQYTDHVSNCLYDDQNIHLQSISDERKTVFSVELMKTKFESGECPFSFGGCEFKTSHESEMQDHIEINLMDHAWKARECFEELRKSQEELMEKLSAAHKENMTLKKNIEIQQKHIGRLDVKIKQWEKDGETIVKEIAHLNSELIPVSEIDELKKLLSSGKSSDSYQRKDAVNKKSSTYEKLLENKLAALEDESVRHNVTLANLNIRLCILNSTTYDGTLMWRIDNLESRMKDARKGTVPSLFSPPFYTTRFGVKLCCRIYLNGDGKCKTKFVSLFIVIMKGEYDDILQWPFKKKITFLLIDQSGDGNDMVKTFHADPNSSSFRKPDKEMNIASGCPYFVDQSVLFSSHKSETKLRTDSPYISKKSIMIKAVVSDP